MKAHVGVEVDSGTVHSLEATTAKVHDSRIWTELLHGEEKSVWADKGYVSAEHEAAFSKDGKLWGVMRKSSKGGQLDPIDEEANRIIAKVRTKVEHPFRVLKRQFGHMKTRYRGLSKNRSCSHCLRSATCSWFDGGCCHEDESAWKAHNRR